MLFFGVDFSPSAHSTVVVSRMLQEYYRSRYAKDCAYVPNGTRIRDRQTGNYLESIGSNRTATRFSSDAFRQRRIATFSLRRSRT